MMSLDAFASVVRIVGLGGLVMFLSSIVFLKDDAPPMIEWTWKQWMTPWNNLHRYRSPGDRLLCWGLVVAAIALSVSVVLLINL